MTKFSFIVFVMVFALAEVTFAAPSKRDKPSGSASSQSDGGKKTGEGSDGSEDDLSDEERAKLVDEACERIKQSGKSDRLCKQLRDNIDDENFGLGDDAGLNAGAGSAAGSAN